MEGWNAKVLSSRAQARDLAREWLELGPARSLAALGMTAQHHLSVSPSSPSLPFSALTSPAPTVTIETRAHQDPPAGRG